MYNCERCGYWSEHANKYRNHIFRQNVCEPKYSEKKIDEIREDFLKLRKELKPVKCEYCNKEFTAYYAKYRHKKNCMIKDQNEKLEKLEKENEKLKSMGQTTDTSLVDYKKTNHDTTQTYENGEFKEIDSKYRKSVRFFVEEKHYSLVYSYTLDNPSRDEELKNCCFQLCKYFNQDNRKIIFMIRKNIASLLVK